VFAAGDFVFKRSTGASRYFILGREDGDSAAR